MAIAKLHSERIRNGLRACFSDMLVQMTHLHSNRELSSTAQLRTHDLAGIVCAFTYATQTACVKPAFFYPDVHKLCREVSARGVVIILMPMVTLYSISPS